MLDIVVTTSRGLDALLADEITALIGEVNFRVTPGQVHLQTDLKGMYTLCLWSRLANRVLVKVAEGEMSEAEDVYRIAQQVNWGSQFDVSRTFAVDFVGTNKHINNTQFGALKIKDAIVDQFNDLYDQRPSVDRQTPDMRIQGRLRRQTLSIYINVSGDSLHQRHYRDQTGAAPLKEHVAAAILMRSGWTQNTDKMLFDPMCGSGTIAIEGALIAANIAPALKRVHWGFDFWGSHDEPLWANVLEEAKKARREPQARILASDNDRGVLKHAKKNADQAGVFQYIQIGHQDALRAKSPDPAEQGYLVCNPPYGERLGEITQLIPFFQQWGTAIKQGFAGWHVSLLTSNRELLRQMKLVADRDYKLMNGKLECQLVNYVMNDDNCRIREQQAEGDFANRLAKNIKRLRKWLKTQDTNCYRLYDADLPEYNVAVDRYADWLVVQEYAAPKNIPPEKARRRLFDVLASVARVCEVDPANVVLKTREQQKGNKQYEKLGEQHERIEVYENGARFYVNLHDYLDTGLFLDHRDTRQTLKSMVQGKDVLNLFAYTGSVSVHAALGKARSVTTVDMSNTYLQWAKQNFALNGLKGAYQFIQDDCMSWLRSHKGRYDVIFIDPPSFSNSKRMNNTWDVQRDHLAMLKDALQCLNPGGSIMFSNNLRSFKLDENGLLELGLKASNISGQTVPEDFARNRKIHQCWILEPVSNA